MMCSDENKMKCFTVFIAQHGLQFCRHLNSPYAEFCKTLLGSNYALQCFLEACCYEINMKHGDFETWQLQLRCAALKTYIRRSGFSFCGVDSVSIGPVYTVSHMKNFSKICP